MSKPSLQNIDISTRYSTITEEEIYTVVTEFGTPLYVVDEQIILDNLSTLENSFNNYNGKTSIAYSLKSNFNPSIIEILNKESILFDLTSLGELYFFEQCRANIDNVLYTSVTEEENEYYSAMQSGISKFVIGSYNGLINLISASESLNISPKVLVRINPEIDVKADISASSGMGKFGIPLSNSSNDDAFYIINKIFDNNLLQFHGIHFHLGSQISNPSCFIQTLDLLSSLIKQLKSSINDFTISILDIGGGTPVEYTKPVPSPEYIGKIITDKLNEFTNSLDISPTLIVESGRYLSAESSILISRIVNSKSYPDCKFHIIDAGYNLLLDSALMKQEYPIDIITRSQSTTLENIKIGGRLCDTLDTFNISPGKKFPRASINDLVVFRNVGAYSIVFNMPFHCQTKPAILLRRTDHSIDIIREPEKIEDLFNSEGGNLSSKQ
ncbi:MAG: hypothetical protein CMO19_03645 [Thaumarchaeota archaeon]|nr:hypothetical protein [Nitrososphaerota archaeon]